MTDEREHDSTFVGATVADDLLMDAWAVIANAKSRPREEIEFGYWDSMDREWVAAAQRWRDRWHEHLRQTTAEVTWVTCERCHTTHAAEGPGGHACDPGSANLDPGPSLADRAALEAKP